MLQLQHRKDVAQGGEQIKRYNCGQGTLYALPWDAQAGMARWQGAEMLQMAFDVAGSPSNRDPTQQKRGGDIQSEWPKQESFGRPSIEGKLAGVPAGDKKWCLHSGER